MTQLASEDTTLLHATRGNPTGLASAIAACLRNHGHAEVDAVGPQCVSTAVKALAIARAYLKPSSYDLQCAPGFHTIPNRNRPGTELTQIIFTVQRVNG